MTALLTFICITLGLAFTAGSFYWGYKVGYMKKLSEDNESFLRQADEEIKRLQSAIETLGFEKDQLITDIKRGQESKTPEPNGWNPFNPLDDVQR